MPGALSRWSRILLASVLTAAPAFPAIGLALPDPDPKWICNPICHPQIFDARVDGPISLEVVASPGEASTPIEVKTLSWSSAELEPLKSADPQEGGQVYSADPQEGGQVVRPADSAMTLAHRKAGHGQDLIAGSSEMTPATEAPVPVPYPNTASRDAASGLPTGKRMHKPLTFAEPVAKKGTVKVSVLMGACVKGQHFKEATITMRRATYHMQDVDVAGCTRTGDDTDTCTLTYASLGQ